MKTQTLAHQGLPTAQPRLTPLHPGWSRGAQGDCALSALLAQGWLQGPQEVSALPAQGLSQATYHSQCTLSPILAKHSWEGQLQDPANPPPAATPGRALGPSLSASQPGASSQQAWAAPAVHSQRQTLVLKA